LLATSSRTFLLSEDALAGTKASELAAVVVLVELEDIEVELASANCLWFLLKIW